MKKPYVKPTLSSRGPLAATTASGGTPFSPVPGPV